MPRVLASTASASRDKIQRFTSSVGVGVAPFSRDALTF